MKLPVLVFDIETVPDTDTGRLLHDLVDLDDKEVVEAMLARRRQATGGEKDFLPPHLQRIVAISVVLKTEEKIAVWSLGSETSCERELVKRFYEGIAQYTPRLVSWNGGGFDLPVLHYRALLHGVAAPTYWESGSSQQEFRWDNYLNRFHERHTDLMDVLAAYSMGARASLEQVAVLLGLPGKMGMSGAQVWETYLSGEINAIRNYCETDVLNTYLVYLRYELIRGQLSEQKYAACCTELRDMLQQAEQAHLTKFAQLWKQRAV